MRMMNGTELGSGSGLDGLFEFMFPFDVSAQLPGLPVSGEPSQWIDRIPGGMSRKEFDGSDNFREFCLHCHALSGGFRSFLL